MKKRLRFIIGLATLTFLGSCVRDTCNGALGNTFQSIELDSTQTPATGEMLAFFSLETLADLPENYFTDVTFVDSTVETVIDSIALTSTGMTLSFVAAALPDSAQTTNLNMICFFGDRRSYIGCQHPGSADTYILEMNIEVGNPANEAYEILTFEWNEIFLAGHL